MRSKTAAIVAMGMLAWGCARKQAEAESASIEIRGVPIGSNSSPRRTAAPLAARRPPANYQATEMPGGEGRILRSSFTGTPSGAHMALQGILADLGQSYFDAPARSAATVESQDGRRAQTIFHTSVGSAASTGLAMVELSDGGGRFTLLIDNSARFRASLPRMAQIAGGGQTAAQTQPRRQIQWTQHSFPDGSGNIALPSDWRMMSAAKGAVDAMGPNGEVIGLGGPYLVNTNQWYAQSGYLVGPYMRPVQAMQALFPQMAVTAARAGYRKQLVRILETHEFQDQGVPGAYILYDCMVNGRPYRFYEMDSTRMIDQSMWMFYQSVVGAPVEVFGREFGTLVQIWQSWQISGRLIASRLRSAVESMREAGEILRSANQSTSAAYDRTNRAWSLYFRGNELVEHVPSGTRGEVDLNYAKRLVESLNEHEGSNTWRVVPMRDY